MLSKSQESFLSVNSERQFIIVGIAALVYNGLMYGNVGGEVLDLYVPVKRLDNLDLTSVRMQYYHFDGFDYCGKFTYGNNLWLPTAERALVDTMEFLDHYWIEGPLIESLQEYIDNHEDLSELYSVAKHYNVSIGKIDHWLKEAIETGSMSMG